MEKTKSRLYYLIPIILVLLVLTPFSACKSGNNSTSTPIDTTTTTTTQTSATNMTITISNFAFSPALLNIKVGDTVIWINKDSVTHTVVSDTAGVFNSGNLAPNDTYSYMFTSTGTFNYHCSIHPSMTGSIVVK